ncbi:MAG: hypothetical protein CVU39_01940 [Chloroflexi bacterium HGW-Chloroflexi-10]|nr:MAG: hypothetical protein CVU39_01940 [Chloroflexi bacterium HGW-Chloroflexi-10]
MKCILCQEENILLIKQFDATNHIMRWKKEFQFDISNEILNEKTIYLYECTNCKLQFYDPKLAGSEHLYTYLNNYPWYYMKEKWEYQTALNDIHPGDKILEIGSGSGYFIKKVLDKKCLAKGLETNQKAVNIAKKNGLPIENQNFLDIQDAKYSVICNFQLLEHLSDPKAFFEKSSQLLPSGGRLIIGVPNGIGWQHQLNLLLDMPPHHITLWSRETMENIEKLFPFKLEKILYEPLPKYHIDLYSEYLAKKIFIKDRFFLRIFYKISKTILRLCVALSSHNPILGMGIYVVFRKI